MTLSLTKLVLLQDTNNDWVAPIKPIDVKYLRRALISLWISLNALALAIFFGDSLYDLIVLHIDALKNYPTAAIIVAISSYVFPLILLAFANAWVYPRVNCLGKCGHREVIELENDPASEQMKAIVTTLVDQQGFLLRGQLVAIRNKVIQDNELELERSWGLKK